MRMPLVQGMRLLVSGFAQKLPRLFALLLRRTLRHLPPPAASAELAAARRAAISAASASRSRGSLPAATIDELQRASPKALQAEAARFFGSVRVFVCL